MAYEKYMVILLMFILPFVLVFYFSVQGPFLITGIKELADLFRPKWEWAGLQTYDL